MSLSPARGGRQVRERCARSPCRLRTTSRKALPWVCAARSPWIGRAQVGQGRRRAGSRGRRQVERSRFRGVVRSVKSWSGKQRRARASMPGARPARRSPPGRHSPTPPRPRRGQCGGVVGAASPAALAPLREVGPLGAEGRVVAVAGVEPRLVGQPVEDLGLARRRSAGRRRRRRRTCCRHRRGTASRR